MNERYAGHNRGIIIMNDGYGHFTEHPMTRAELAAREVAASIQDNIYRYANTAGSCYHELWQMISASIQQGMIQEAEKSKSEITRLTAELQQAHQDIDLYKTLSRGYQIRAETAEQQVAALVEALKEAREWIGSVAGNGSHSGAAVNYINSILSALPDRAKKIQAVVEAAKNKSERLVQWLPLGEYHTLHPDDEKIVKAIRDLES